jgi:hypothetical protein
LIRTAKVGETMTYSTVQLAAISASVLIALVAIFQVALALGLPLGEATFGGAAPTIDGVLSTGFRVIALVNAVILIGFAWVILARADLLSSNVIGDRFLFWAAWGIVAFLVLNTIGNLSASHPFERYVMGATTLVLIVLCALVAYKGPVESGM